MTLTEFLLARIAEDEALWSLAVQGGMAFIVPSGPIPTAVPPSGFSRRMLAECEAKRQVVQEAARLDPEEDYTIGLLSACEYLALPYTDHPDYRDEWRVEVAPA